MLSVNLLTNSSINLATVYLSLSFSLNLLLSLAIILRMLHLRRSVPFVLNSRSSTRLYTSIVSMFVESASLYTLISLVCIIAVGLAIPMQNALLPMLGQLQVRLHVIDDAVESGIYECVDGHRRRYHHS